VLYIALTGVSRSVYRNGEVLIAVLLDADLDVGAAG
jgi:hypothetical protein